MKTIPSPFLIGSIVTTRKNSPVNREIRSSSKELIWAVWDDKKTRRTHGQGEDEEEVRARPLF
jgi:hypothetical protein